MIRLEPMTAATAGEAAASAGMAAATAAGATAAAGAFHVLGLALAQHLRYHAGHHRRPCSCTNGFGGAYIHLHLEGVLGGDLLPPLKAHQGKVAEKGQAYGQKGVGHVPEGRGDPLPAQDPDHLLESLDGAGAVIAFGSIGVDVVGDLVAALPVDGLIYLPSAMSWM